MPAQQRSRPDEQPVPARAGQQPGQASQQGSVGPVHPRAGHLAAQYGDLAAQHEQLASLAAEPRQEPKPPHHLAEHQVERSKGHAAIIAARWLLHELAAQRHDRLSGTHTPPGSPGSGRRPRPSGTAPTLACTRSSDADPPTEAGSRPHAVGAVEADEDAPVFATGEVEVTADSETVWR